MIARLVENHYFNSVLGPSTSKKPKLSLTPIPVLLNPSEELNGCGLNSKVLSSGPISSVAAQGAAVSSAANACPGDGSLQSNDRDLLVAATERAQNPDTKNDVHENDDQHEVDNSTI